MYGMLYWFIWSLSYSLRCGKIIDGWAVFLFHCINARWKFKFGYHNVDLKCIIWTININMIFPGITSRDVQIFYFISSTFYEFSLHYSEKKFDQCLCWILKSAFFFSAKFANRTFSCMRLFSWISKYRFLNRDIGRF